jgi:hypothetical protein
LDDVGQFVRARNAPFPKKYTHTSTCVRPAMNEESFVVLVALPRIITYVCVYVHAFM